MASAAPTYNEPFFMTLAHNGQPENRVWHINSYPDPDSLTSLEKAITAAKRLNGQATVYYCVPVGEADAAHSHMKSTLEVLGSAAIALEEGGYDRTEGTALT